MGLTGLINVRVMKDWQIAGDSRVRSGYLIEGSKFS